MFCLELCVLDHLHELKLGLCQIRMPKINYQNQPCFVPIVPGLMVKTVIEDISFSCHLLASFIVNSHSAATDSHQRKMEPEFFVGWTVMPHYVRLRCQCAEKSVMIIVRNVFINELHGKGNLFAIVVEFHIM